MLPELTSSGEGVSTLTLKDLGVESIGASRLSEGVFKGTAVTLADTIALPLAQLRAKLHGAAVEVVRVDWDSEARLTWREGGGAEPDPQAEAVCVVTGVRLGSPRIPPPPSATPPPVHPLQGWAGGGGEGGVLFHVRVGVT